MGPALNSRRLPSGASVPKSLIARLGFFWAMAASSNDLVSLWIDQNGVGHVDVDADLFARSGDLVSREFRGDADSAEWHVDLHPRARRLDELDGGDQLHVTWRSACTRLGNVLGPEPQNNGLAVGRVAPGGQGEPSSVAKDHFAGFDGGGKEVHLRAAEEARHEARCRPLEQIERRAELFNFSVAQQRDAVSECHRLDLVVSDVDDGTAEFLMEPLDFNPH